jgi:hypothetical protein
MATATTSIVINNKSKKQDILDWAKQTHHEEWLKEIANTPVEHKVYPKVPDAEGKMVEDKTQPYVVVMRKPTFMGIKKRVMTDFFSNQKKKKSSPSFIDEINSL